MGAQVLGLTHALVRFGTMTHPVQRALRDTIVPAASHVGPVHRRAVRRWTQVNVGYPASSLTWPDRGRGRPRPGSEPPTWGCRRGAAASRLFTVLRRGRHVMVVTGAGQFRTAPLPAPPWSPPGTCSGLIPAATGDAFAFRGGAGRVCLPGPADRSSRPAEGRTGWRR